jgi:Zn-dependent M28 family amino/carboxypeptidase
LPAATLEQVLAGDGSPLGLAALLIGRPSAERQAVLASYLERRRIAFDRHAFSTFEGRGENFAVDIGSGDRALILIAHHDAVPGSPGANDNAAAVGILLHLLEGMIRRPPSGLRVRFLFTACEELGYLGARAYVKDHASAGLVGALSLELCGIGDALAVWDVDGESEFLTAITRALDRCGLRRDDSYHVVGRIPIFGSDHRAFAAAGISAYGFSIVPSREAEALRRFALSPTRSVLMHVVHRPAPFDTYHTSGDGQHTLDEGACAAALAGLQAIIAELAADSSALR